MLVFKSIAWIPALVILGLGANAALSATVFETTQLAAATASADADLPAPVTFVVTTAGSYTVTLTDLGTPQELSSLRAVVTRDVEPAAELAVEYPASPLLPATTNFTATPGTYRIHVLGVAASGAAGGSFGVSVAPSAGGATLIDHVGVINAPAQSSDGLSALQTSFPIATAGTYRLVLTDLAFPAALTSSRTLVLRETGSTPVVVLDTQGFVPATFAATPGTYQLLIVAQAAAPELAGLYSVSIDSGIGTLVVYQYTQAVGTLAPATAVTIATAGQHTLTLADISFPASLDALAGVVTQNGAVLGTLGAAGAVSFSAVQGTTQIYARATPNPTDEVGAFSVQLARGAQNLYADVWIADTSPEPSTPTIYAVTSSDAVTSGAYQLRIEDFAFPLAFASLKSAVTQGSAVVGTLNGAGTGQFTLQASPVKVLVAVRPPAGASPNALFGLTVTPAGGAEPLLETTQGVGGLFRTHVVSIATAGPYDLTLADLEFPSAMPTAALAITRGTTLIAQVYGGGTVPRQQLTAGTYVLNFLGQPAASETHGTYGIRVADSPPLPAVTLSANPATITSGGQTTLQWTATNATACTASNGWTGTKSASGSESVGPLNSTATFALACTGPGGAGNASVTVTVSPPRARGGGGALGLQFLAALCLLVAMRSASKTRSSSN